MLIDLGTHKQKEKINHELVLTKSIRNVLGSCGCTNLSFEDTTVKFIWQLPEFPFQRQDTFCPIFNSITVYYKDDTIEVFELKSIITK